MSWDPLPAFYNDVPPEVQPRPSGVHHITETSSEQNTHASAQTHNPPDDPGARHEAMAQMQAMPDLLWRKVQFWRAWDKEVCIRQGLL